MTMKQIQFIDTLRLMMQHLSLALAFVLIFYILYCFFKFKFKWPLFHTFGIVGLSAVVFMGFSATFANFPFVFLPYPSSVTNVISEPIYSGILMFSLLSSVTFGSIFMFQLSGYLQTKLSKYIAIIFITMFLIGGYLIFIQILKSTVFYNTNVMNGQVGFISNQAEGINCLTPYVFIKVTKQARIDYLCQLPYPKIKQAESVDSSFYITLNKNQIEKYHKLNPILWSLSKWKQIQENIKENNGAYVSESGYKTIPLPKKDIVK